MNSGKEPLSVTIELTRGEIELLGHPQPRQFHDMGDKLMLAESLIPRLQSALVDAQQRAYRAAEKRELADAAEAAIEELLGKKS